MKNRQGLFQKRVKCYNAPECRETISVKVSDKEDSPRKLCSACRDLGQPAERSTAGHYGALESTGEGTSWGKTNILYFGEPGATIELSHSVNFTGSFRKAN